MNIAKFQYCSVVLDKSRLITCFCAVSPGYKIDENHCSNDYDEQVYINLEKCTVLIEQMQVKGRIKQQVRRELGQYGGR